MAKHAKKKRLNKIEKISISIFSIVGLALIISWSWILLEIPFISNKAEVFVKKNLAEIFLSSKNSAGIIDKNTINSQKENTNKDKNYLGPEGDNESGKETETSISNKDSKNKDEDVKPSIRLQIYEGPIYSNLDESCSYIVKAVVSGKPFPDIKFSRDDSNGALGFDKAKISLKQNMRSYTLTATASNYLGTVMDSITLNWGCNSSPKILEIKLSSDIIFVNSQYEISANATDPEGTSLTYKWTVSGGTLNNDSAQTIKWNTPSKSGDYEIKLAVKDKSGAEATKTISVYVGDLNPPETTSQTSPPTTTTTTTEPPAMTTTTEPVSTTTTTEPQESSFNLPKKTNEGGYLEYGGATYTGGDVYAGDSEGNNPCMGFISFDITSLQGKSVVSATLTLSNAVVYDSPLSYLDSLWVNIVDWGAEPIVQNDFNLIGIAVQNFTNPSISCNAETLKSQLQSAINSGKQRFQIRIHFSGPYTDNDNKKDGW